MKHIKIVFSTCTRAHTHAQMIIIPEFDRNVNVEDGLHLSGAVE